MKLLSAIGAGIRAFRNQFDGASDNPQRTSTAYFPLDSAREINPSQRREMVKKHRSLRNNLGFVRGMIRTTVRLSIGHGLKPCVKSPDASFNARALDYWKRYTDRQAFDIAGQDTEAAMQRLVLSEVITDGEMFAIKVFDDFSKPQRQLLKTEMIGDPFGVNKSDNWIDGIWVNSHSRPLGYSVLQRPTPQSPLGRRAAIVAPKDMLHIYDRERSTQMRGLPWGYTGLNHGVDLLDIVAFEKVTHKLNTAIIGGLTTPDGQVPASMQGLLAAANDASAAGTTRNTREAVKYLDIQGSSIPIFKTGEAMNMYLQGRNSINTTEFAGWLAAQYAQGFGLPVELVVEMATNGTAVRGNLELAGRFFEEVQMLMVDDWCQPNWENIIGTALLAAAYPKDYPGIEPLAPPDGKTWEGWNNVEWRGPKNITVDHGRDGKLYLELLRAGKMTSEKYHTMFGESPETDTQSIDEVETQLKYWLSKGLPEDKFWPRLLGQVGVGQNQQQQTQEPATV